MMEAQARCIVQAVRRVAAGARLDVRPEVAAAFDAEMQHRLASSVWAACTSWYRDAGGRVVTNWPGLVQEYLDRTAVLDPSDFQDPGARLTPEASATHR